MSRDSSAEHFVHVGRQPVYDRDNDVVGYELLFRSGHNATAATQSGTEASSQVIVNAFTEFGLEQLVGNRLGFVNLTRDFLVGELAVPFDPTQAVLEVLETVEVDDAVLAGVGALAERGYRIALDDFEWGSGHEQLLPVAGYVKLQVAGIDRDVVHAAVKACRTYPGLQLLAERLETDADLRFARDLGFDLFQGYLLGRPEVMSAASLSPSQVRRIELLGYLGRPDVSLSRVASIVALDPALSFRMLRASSSAAAGQSRRVSSVQEAMVLLGTTRLTQWLSLMAISDLTKPSEDYLVPLLARARLCQLIAEQMHLDGAAAFTAGTLVGVGELLATPPAELTAQLPLTDEVARALSGEQGGLGAVLAAVRGYGEGTMRGLSALPISSIEMSRYYLIALEWALRTYQTVLS